VVLGTINMKICIFIALICLNWHPAKATFTDETCHADKAKQIDPKDFQNRLHTEITEILENKDDFEYHKSKCEDVMNYSLNFMNNANNCLDEKFKSLIEFIHGITINLVTVLCDMQEDEFYGEVDNIFCIIIF
jgi:hypothetical protein